MRANGKYNCLYNILYAGLKVRILDKVEENRFVLMVQCMKVGGKITKQMEMED